MADLNGIIEDIKQIQNDDDAYQFTTKHPEGGFEKLLSTVTENDWAAVKELILVCIESKNFRVMHYAESLMKKRKLIDWKKHPDIFEDVLQHLVKHGAERSETDHATYCKFTQKLVILLKSLQMAKKYQDRYYEIALAALDSVDNQLLVLLCFVVYDDMYSWENHPDHCCTVLEKAYVLLQENPELSESHKASMPIDGLIQYILIAQNTRTARVISEPILKLFLLTSEAEWIDNDDMSKHTVSHIVLSRIMEDYYQTHRNITEILKPVWNKIMELKDCEDDIISRDGNNIFTLVTDNIGELMGENLDIVVKEFLRDPSAQRMNQTSIALKSNPVVFKQYVNELVMIICTNPQSDVIASGMGFLWDLAKELPEEFDKNSIKALVDTLAVPESHAMGLLSLAILVKTHAEEMLQYDDKVIQSMKISESMSSQGAGVLNHLATLGENYAKKYLQVYADMSQTAGDGHDYYLIYCMKVVGDMFPHLLQVHREYLETLLNKPQLQQMAQTVIDTMEGRSLGTLAQDITEQKGDIKTIDDKVTKTEDRVDEVADNVEVIEKDVGQLRTDVNEQGEKVETLDKTVAETVVKVEEIDKKTLSHAPKWSCDLAKLMNPATDYDWRYLATKLGYSNDDIRNWATQPDPCLSLLDEWFATHKTRDATFAVEQALNDMHRIDAAMIVENALKETEDVVVDDESEAWDPPPIFISYQWGHQPEVKLLHKHLEMAGYKSWMDIGQMGGGDKLFEMIDRGIRAAKVIICCVSEKYAKSPNCNREVNLAVTLGKPIIPLLMEKLSWPPPGSMGPMFSEYIFVRFFARPGKTAGDDRYWPTAKFQELLMQIRYTHAPEKDVMSGDLYKDWWNPPEEIIEIKPKENKATSTTVTNSNQAGSETTPDVFISYQWGKQPQIKQLFKVLTSQGYSCWLDIMQMGGGDSLYDKIDKGVRGCKVVVSCVTSKYALSANCRREVSLADAIKKPIIPLLLEQITWPPSGPMSMPFTQLLYIDFCKPSTDIQDHWNCPQVAELYNKLTLHIPQIKPVEDSERSSLKQDEEKNQITDIKQEKSEPAEKDIEQPAQNVNSNFQASSTAPQNQGKDDNVSPDQQSIKSSSCVIL